jgi:predicted ATPase with chaperone activity
LSVLRGPTDFEARNTLQSASLEVASPIGSAAHSNGRPVFYPKAVDSLEASGLNSVTIESLVLKFLLSTGMASGRRIASLLGLPFGPFPEFLRVLKNQQILAYANSASANDYVYTLTDTGRVRAKVYAEECAYVGTAPVPFEDYLQSVAAQTISNEHPREADLRRAFADLMIPEETFGLLGPALNSGQGLFLYGSPGNGKTSIAERITRCFNTNVWIPQVIWVEGQTIKLFDQANHEPVETARTQGLLDDSDYDRRWVQIKRPTIVAGGELRMDDLEIHVDHHTHVSEAPLQLKSNLGSFLIDDFGRQQMRPVELLNRWIVPLERRYDFLRLANGKKIRVPFDQLIIFSTNLEPAELVDEAFLRRIPYKIHATDPSQEMFRNLIGICARRLGFETVDQSAVDHLIDHHYRRTGRPFRYCHPRDLLLQVRNSCVYNNVPLELKPEYFDFAAMNYFTAQRGEPAQPIPPDPGPTEM